MCRSLKEIMKARILLFPLVLFLVVPAAAQTAKMDDIADFLKGTWKINDKERYEQWKVFPDKLDGRGFNLEKGLEKVYETLEIKLIDGKINYLATVPDQNEGKTIAFPLTSSSVSELTFENADHDFPKKIIYKKLSPTEITVSVFGEGEKGFSLKLIKVSDEVNFFQY